MEDTSPRPEIRPRLSSKKAAMRVVMRILFIEFSAAWVMVLAGMVRTGLQAVPLFAGTLATAGRRVGWRAGLGTLVGLPVVAGWPLLFWLIQAEQGYHAWMKGIAIPWWIVLACCGLVVLAARGAAKAEPGA
jgi:hypothetical protein